MRRARRGGGKHPRLRARPMASLGDQAEVAVGLRWTSPTSSSRGGSRSPPQGVPGELRWPLPREAATLALQSPSSLTLAAQKGMAIANVLQSETTAETQRAQALARPAVVGHAAAAGPPWRGLGPAPAQDRLAEHRSRRDAIGVKAQERGWPVFERGVSGLITPYYAFFDIGSFTEEACREWFDMSEICTASRQLPLTPLEFTAVLETKTFTSGADRDVVRKKYEQTFIEAQLEEYKLLSTVYQDELRAATETVESLRCESQVWERRILEEADRCPVAGCCCNGGRGARGAARGGATTPCGARVADPLLFHGEPGGAGGASPPVRDGEPRVLAPLA